MNYLFYLCLISIFIFTSCKEETKIDLNISDDKLTNVLVDMHYLEGIVQKTTRLKKDSVRQAIKQQITDIYDFDSIEDLDSLLVKAQSYPDYFKKIQAQSTTFLDSLEKKLNADFKKNIKK